jgi:hypothetical protein
MNNFCNLHFLKFYVMAELPEDAINDAETCSSNKRLYLYITKVQLLVSWMKNLMVFLQFYLIIKFLSQIQETCITDLYKIFTGFRKLIINNREWNSDVASLLVVLSDCILWRDQCQTVYMNFLVSFPLPHFLDDLSKQTQMSMMFQHDDCPAD